ncbi:hypothetical protein VQL36_01450 [Chengkuizengella sp. SCS-71B]|uniref:hypothetical protein n=1 Tax=Chengkuizengella sp. SCS-71B TaxID=3115290 RepID=UPI0032C220B7
MARAAELNVTMNHYEKLINPVDQVYKKVTNMFAQTNQWINKSTGVVDRLKVQSKALNTNVEKVKSTISEVQNVGDVAQNTWQDTVNLGSTLKNTFKEAQGFGSTMIKSWQEAENFGQQVKGIWSETGIKSTWNQTTSLVDTLEGSLKNVETYADKAKGAWGQFKEISGSIKGVWNNPEDESSNKVVVLDKIEEKLTPVFQKTLTFVNNSLQTVQKTKSILSKVGQFGKTAQNTWKEGLEVSKVLQGTFQEAKNVGKTMKATWNETGKFGNRVKSIWSSSASVGDKIMATWQEASAFGSTVKEAWNQVSSFAQTLKTTFDSVQKFAKTAKGTWDQAKKIPGQLKKIWKNPVESANNSETAKNNKKTKKQAKEPLNKRTKNPSVEKAKDRPIKKTNRKKRRKRRGVAGLVGGIAGDLLVGGGSGEGKCCCDGVPSAIHAIGASKSVTSNQLSKSNKQLAKVTSNNTLNLVKNGKSVAKGATKRIPIIGTLLSAADIVTAKDKKQAIGETAGGVIGATLGGTIGSVIPVIGTAIGATIGGALGSWAGGKLASMDMDKVKERFTSIKDTAINQLVKMTDLGRSTMEKVQEFGSSILDKTKVFGTSILNEAKEMGSILDFFDFSSDINKNGSVPQSHTPYHSNVTNMYSNDSVESNDLGKQTGNNTFHVTVNYTGNNDEMEHDVDKIVDTMVRKLRIAGMSFV